MSARRGWLVATGITVLLLGALGSVGYSVMLRPRLLTGRQVRNHAQCQVVEARLRQAFESNGRYPITLAEVGRSHGEDHSIDSWGHSLFYQSDGSTFLLVSYGRDGRPDGSDYLALREQGDHPGGYNTCGNFDADEVMSDLGWHRLCGK